MFNIKAKIADRKNARNNMIARSNLDVSSKITNKIHDVLEQNKVAEKAKKRTIWIPVEKSNPSCVLALLNPWIAKNGFNAKIDVKKGNYIVTITC